MPQSTATRRPTVAVLLAGLLLAGAALVGCSSDDTSSPATTAEGGATTTTNPYGAGEVDPPGPDDTVLTVTGPTGTKDFTLTSLAALGTKEVTISEPFVKSTITFTGVPMAAIFGTVGIEGPVKVATVALNDYEYDGSTAEEFVESEGLVAVAQEGEPVDVDQGGPIRIIFPDGTSLSENLDAWNWSLASMSAKAAA